MTALNNSFDQSSSSEIDEQVMATKLRARTQIIKVNRRAGICKHEISVADALYPNVINIGKITGHTQLEQIFCQLKIKESEYLWWNSQEPIEFTVPSELQDIETGRIRSSSFSNIKKKRDSELNKD